MKLAILGSALAVSMFAQPETRYPQVRGTRDMVGAANPLETDAGLQMLNQGGNAVDAGVAATLVATVTEQSRVGLGGEIPILIKMNGQPVISISGIGVAPAKATVEYYKNRQPEDWEKGMGARRPAPIPAIGPRAAITPGLFDGLLVALEKYGTLSFAQVVKPAIQAAGGFAPGDEFSDFLKDLLEYHRRWTDSFWFFYPTGRAPLRGDSLELPTLAKTFESLAEAETKAQGSREQKIQAVHDYFYKGPIAHKLADASAALDGLITYDDLANFHAEIDQPRSTEYRGYTIWKPGFWTQGPVLLETLNLLEGYQLEPMRHNYPEYLHTVIEATKLAFADRDQYYGDPKFSKIPEATLLSKEYAAERRKLIEVGKASEVSRPGQLNASAPAQGGGGVSTNKDTTSIDIVDKDGNAFSATPSGAWIPSVIAGDTGIPFSVRLESFVLTPNHANQLAPGKRPRVTLSPTIVTKGDKLIGVLSTPGGDNQDQALLQVLLNIIDFNMPPQQAVEAARFTSQHFYSSFGYHELYPAVVKFENRIPDSIATVLRQRGHKIDYEEAWSNSSAPVVIWMRDGWSKGVVLEGGADPRRNRVIFAR